MTTSLHQVSVSLQFNQILEIVKQLGIEERCKLLLYLLGHKSDNNDLILTHFASEQVLSNIRPNRIFIADKNLIVKSVGRISNALQLAVFQAIVSLIQP